MKRNNLRKSLIGLLSIIAFVIFGFFGPVEAKEAGALPRTMFWSCYDVGSSGYIQASAIADALLKKYGTKVRLLPSGTTIGRLIPITTRKVECGFLANGVFFAAEGLYDFAVREWGPQDLRVILGHPASVGMAVTRKSGIKTFADFKGKRIVYVPGAPTLNIKAEAFLAFAGLTWDDVKKTEFPSYGASQKAIKEGKVDSGIAIPTSSFMYDLESTPAGLHWPQVPLDNKEGWERLHKIAPFLSPYKETIGAGVSKENPAYLAAYRYPMITVYADTDPDWVYAFVKALDEAYPLYEKAHKMMSSWQIKQAGVSPADAPYHEGAIRYLKEKGIWTSEDDIWNNARIGHLKKVQKAWEATVKKADAKKMKSKVFPEFWLKERAKALGD